MHYTLYRGYRTTGDRCVMTIMAIHTDRRCPCPPADYFLCGTDRIEAIGEIEIEGDTQWLPDNFEVESGDVPK
jgi:hypothetical protein